MFKRAFRAAGAALVILMLGVGAAQAQPANAARTLIDQSTVTCRPETTFRFTVVDAVATRTIVDYTASDDRTWVVAVVDVTNLGSQSNFIQALVKARDERGREYYWTTFNGPDIVVEDGLAAQFGVKPSWQAFEPGIAERTVIPIEIDNDVRTLTLLPDPLSCTPPAATATMPASMPASSTAGGTTASQPPAGTIPDPAASLVGQSMTACKAATRFRFDVIATDWRMTIVDRTARNGAMWAVVKVDITNLSAETDYAQGRAKVRDDRGREFSWRLFNGLDIYVEDDLAAEYGVTASWEGIDPGIPLRTVLIFEVAADARSLALIPDNLACSG
jgi:hypothetical protein